MRNIVQNHRVKFHDDRTQNEGALGFFRRASPPNNNNNNNKKISRDWGPVPGPKRLHMDIPLWLLIRGVELDFQQQRRIH